MTSITVSGLGSGLSYDSWITQLVAIKQADIDEVSAKVTAINSKEGALNTIEADYTNLKSAIETFTNALSTTDVFNQKAVKSSSDAVSATVTAGANAGNVKVSVTSLATATTAQSKNPVSSYVDTSTKMSEISGGAVTAGTFSIYVGGKKTTLNLTSTETLGDLKTALNGITGVTADITADGKLTIGPSGSDAVAVGSSSDTSNFTNVMSLTPTTVDNVTTYSSSRSIFDTDTSVALTSANFAGGTIKAGTFTIGGASFTINSTTTLDDLISEINGSEDAGAKAAWDANAGKLILTSTEEGAVNINVQAGDGTVGDTDASNFTDIMGLTSSTWDGSNNLLTSNLATDSQTLGTNAKFTINGTTITSTSNTITSDVSGIKGLTLTLKDETTSTADVTITQDTSKASTAINSFVTALNKLISDTDSATSTSGKLYGESILNSLRNKLRTMTTAATTIDGAYNNLSQIGISTGKIDTTGTSSTNQLTIDADKLAEALAADPDSVKKLLAGDGTNEGVLDKLDTVVDSATDSVNGFFVTKEKSYEKQKTNYNKKITTMTKNLEKYQTQLEAKFAAMDQLIASLKKSSSIFDSYFNNNNNSSSS